MNECIVAHIYTKSVENNSFLSIFYLCESGIYDRLEANGSLNRCLSVLPAFVLSSWIELFCKHVF